MRGERREEQGGGMRSREAEERMRNGEKITSGWWDDK